MRKRRRYVWLFVAVAVVATAVVVARMRRVTVQPGSHLLLRIRGPYVDAPPQDWLGRLLGSRQHGLIDLLTTIRTAQADARIAGIVLRINEVECGWAKIQEIRDALKDFRRSGKSVAAVLEHQALTANREYYLATAADRLYLAPGSAFPLCGLAAQFAFFGDVWAKLDIDMQVEQIREYKTAGDMIGGRKMSAAHREMANSILDSVESQFVGDIARDRRLSPDQVRAVIDRCPVVPAEFGEAALSDGTQQLADVLAPLRATDQVMEMEDYAGVTPASVGIGTGPRIALLLGTGVISTGRSTTGVQGPTLGADTVCDALDEAADADDVRAIVFRIDSPGGSALASDLIWRAVTEARRKKPVIVSMSDVAGSGGYYIAAGATRIVAHPATLTGSIGVVFVRPSVGRLLTRLGIHTETLSRGKFATLDDLTIPLTKEARQRVRAELEHTYQLFLSRVADGRQLPAERVDELGRGRVWTGAQAKEHGLVDEVGGLARAVEAAKAAAGIPPESEVELVFYPEPEGLLARLGEVIDARLVARLPRAWVNVLAQVGLPVAEGAPLALMTGRYEIR